MKTDIHPTDYRPVIFEDITSGQSFLVFSSVATEATGKWTDGKEYDLYKTEISSASHPFYTGEETTLDRAGRADKFRKRAAKAASKKTVKKAEKVAESSEAASEGGEEPKNEEAEA